MNVFNCPILALDLEGSGDRASENPTLEVGAVIKTTDGKTLAKFHEFGHCDPDQYEVRCVKDFWNRPDVDPTGTKRMRYEEAQDAYHMWKNFYEWIEKHTKDLKNFIIVSDNPAYDCGVASYNFDRYFHGMSLHYVGNRDKDGNKTYVKIRDVHSAVESLAKLCGMERKAFEEKILESYYKDHEIEKSDHDHDALNDANKIANTWLAMANFLDKNNFKDIMF